MSRILVVNLNPTFQQSFFYESFEKDAVNRARMASEQFAGKGFNLVRILSLLGDRPVYLTHLGARRLQEVVDETRSLGGELAYALSSSPMRTCVTVLESDGGRTTEFSCEAAPIEGDGIEARIRSLFDSLIVQEDIKWMVIAGTQAPGYSASLFPDMVRRASEEGKRAVLDIAGPNLLGCLPFHPAVVKPNRVEFERTFGIPGADRRTFEKKVAEVARERGVSLLITCGAEGALLSDRSGQRWLPVARRVENPVNATGCGDVFTAGMTHLLAQGRSLEEAAAFGAECAARRIMRMDVGL